jgi:hypothetical protein
VSVAFDGLHPLLLTNRKDGVGAIEVIWLVSMWERGYTD